MIVRLNTMYKDLSIVMLKRNNMVLLIPFSYVLQIIYFLCNYMM